MIPKSQQARALRVLGVACYQSGKLDEALASFDKALSLEPDDAGVYSNRGAVLKGLKRLDEALDSYDKALSLQPGSAVAHYNRGIALLDLRRPDEALASYDQALTLKPDMAEAHNNRGIALLQLRRLEEALASYDRALSLTSGYAEAHINRGNALKDLNRLDEALAGYDKALALNPRSAQACTNRAHTLKDLGRLDEALASFGNALSLDPDCDFLSGMYLHVRMLACDWNRFSEDVDRLEVDIAGSKRSTAPFPALSLFDKPELHRKAATVYRDAKFPKGTTPAVFPARSPGGKIRIGYYSADFHDHATAHLMAELFEAHSADRFELHGFSFGPDRKDGMRQRLSCAFDRFFDVREMSDRKGATMSRDLGIDIAVDLKGYTQDARPGIFAEGCAPIQVNYLGYPGTMGADYMDYVIADKTVIPVERQPDFTEKVVYLPHCYQPNDSKRRISGRVFTRQELGLPATGFVFCCFNNNYKILPGTFDGWMRILKAVEGSVLWLLADNPTAQKNLLQQAQARGVASDRLVFARRMKLDEHLARHTLADLFIDTLPCNAHTTASDALWAGLPVLTLMGRSFASRVAASLLGAIGLPELVAPSQEAYEARAIALALDPAKMAELKKRLAANRTTTPLFDGNLFARHIEVAYERMHARHQAGLEPAAIEVQPGATTKS